MGSWGACQAWHHWTNCFCQTHTESLMSAWAFSVTWPISGDVPHCTAWVCLRLLSSPVYILTSHWIDTKSCSLFLSIALCTCLLTGSCKSPDSIPCGAFCRNPVTGRDTGVTGGFATSCGTSLALTGNVSISITFISGSLTAVLDTLGMHCLCVWVIWMMSSVLYSVTYVWWKHVCNAADENLLHAWLLRLCSHMTLCCHISHDCCI